MHSLEIPLRERSLFHKDFWFSPLGLHVNVFAAKRKHAFSRYTIYSPKDGQPCMDHDRQTGEVISLIDIFTYCLWS